MLQIAKVGLQKILYLQLHSYYYFLFCFDVIFSLAPLVKKIHERQILEMANKLCDKLLNGKEQHRDISSIALKTIVSEVPTSSIAQSILVSISPKLIRGITSQVSYYIPFSFISIVQG